jgi:hypothetical protein
MLAKARAGLRGIGCNQRAVFTPGSIEADDLVDIYTEPASGGGLGTWSTAKLAQKRANVAIACGANRYAISLQPLCSLCTAFDQVISFAVSSVCLFACLFGWLAGWVSAATCSSAAAPPRSP